MAVEGVADSLGCTLFECASVAEAVDYLRQAQFLCVVCEEELPDGDWASLLAETERLGYRIGMIVIPRSPGCRRRVEELNLDGYDIAAAPQSVEGLRRVVNIAAARWHLARVWASAKLRKPPSRAREEEAPRRFAAGAE